MTQKPPPSSSSNQSPNPSENSSTTPSNTSPQEHEYTLKELRIAQVFVLIITIGLFTVVIGAIWSIGDIFSENKFGAFLTLSTYYKFLLVGMILLGLFILSIFMAVFYRRGRNAILHSLFYEKPEERKDIEEYMPAKIITAGSLISIFTIFIGLFIALIQFLAGGTSNQFWGFLVDLTGGNKVLLSGGLIMGVTALALAFVYLWNNGYFWIIKKILRRNEKITISHSFTEKQKMLGRVLYIIFICSVLVMFLGIVWAIADAINPSGKWNDFIGYPFGIQLTLIALFATGVFGLLVGSMMLYKWGMLAINTALFVRMEPSGLKKDNMSAKIIAGGILASIFLIVISLIIWLISSGIQAIAGSEVANIFVNLAELSNGLAILVVGFLILLFSFLFLSFVYVFNNGYFLLLKKVVEAQDKIDKGFDKAEEKIKIKKN